MTVLMQSPVIIATSIMPIPLSNSEFKRFREQLYNEFELGARREEISSVQAYQSYRQRFDLEHTFRFKKQNLLLNGFKTPEVDHEEQ
jgi:hypothetical protein